MNIHSRLANKKYQNLKRSSFIMFFNSKDINCLSTFIDISQMGREFDAGDLLQYANEHVLDC